MTFFQFKHFLFINDAIKQIVDFLKFNKKNKCFFVNLKNPTFWVKDPRGEEIIAFFNKMTDNQKIEFFGFFDIFIVGFGENGMPFLSMTADPSSQKFEHTVRISVSKGYNRFKERCAPRASPSGDLRGSIGSFELVGRESSTSPFGSFDSGFPSVERGPAIAQYYSPFEHGLLNFGVAGPASGFQPFFGGNATSSIFDHQPQVGGHNPFTEVVPSTIGPLSRKVIRKGRVVQIEIPSECLSGPSTSSTIEKKKSPRTPTLENLRKKIFKLESQNLGEQNPDFLELQILRAKLKKLENSL